jgi:hypothetical protein
LSPTAIEAGLTTFSTSFGYATTLGWAIKMASTSGLPPSVTLSAWARNIECFPPQQKPAAPIGRFAASSWRTASKKERTFGQEAEKLLAIIHGMT